MEAVALTPKRNLSDVLKGARVSTESKTKSKVPLIETSQEIRELTQKVKDLKDELDSLQSMFDLKGGELISLIKPIRETYCKQREFISSVKLPTLDGLTLTMSFSSNYVKCSPDNEESIIRAIGQEKFDLYFNVLNSIKVKSDLSNDMLEELINRIGAEDFATFFDVETNLKPNERFKQDQFFNLTKPERERLEDAGIRAYKPSIKR